MARRLFRTLRIVAIILVVVLVPFALMISHDSPCATPAAPGPGAAAMQGIVRPCYGTPDVIRLQSLAKPVPAADEVLVKVRAASVNPLDWHYLHGKPYLVRFDSGFGAPKNPRLGVDFAGVVAAVGSNVRRFKPGDAVFGGRFGAFAEYLTVRADRAIALKPDNVTFAQAATVPVAALTALQALRDQGHVHAGEKVLINGASGGVGTFAVQIAKAYGAEVTGVCSTHNLELVRSLGADHVVDYTRADVTRGAQRYDVIIDLAGGHGLFDFRRVLTPDGIYVGVGEAGGPDSGGNWIGAMTGPIKMLLLRPFIHQHMGFMLAQLDARDLATLAELMQSGKVTPVIDRTYRLAQVADALRYLEKGHARGKVVIQVADDTAAGAADATAAAVPPASVRP